MKPAVAQVSSLDSPFEKDVEDYAAGACQAIELWVGKLDTYLETHSVAQVRELFDRHQVVAPVVSFQGGLLASQGDFRREHWASFGRRLASCRDLGIATLVLAADIAGPLDDELLERVRLSLDQSARQAGDHGVRLALEFQARSAFASNLETAAALVAEIGSPHLGVCFDSFHYYIGPSKFEDLGYLTRENLFHVQFSDLSGMPRELATDADRILPGDGDFQWEPIVNQLRQIGYNGYVSVELMNPQIWRVPARQFGEVAITALRKLLGQASMD
jgi:sugar phosphate isomerase/epimerase